MPSAAAKAASSPVAASASTCAVASATSSAVWLSSSTAKRAGTFASNGTRCRRRSQKAWMVSILRPPGVSTARAKRRRASLTLAALGRSPSSSVSSAISSGLVQRHPASEPLEDADRHVGGGRLGEGEAQEPARMRAAERAGARRGRSGPWSCRRRHWPTPRRRRAGRRRGAAPRRCVRDDDMLVHGQLSSLVPPLKGRADLGRGSARAG